jgi:glycosyltransferase involved in cell wall biosynthesis
MKPRICLVSETLWHPFNEGMKIFALHLARYLAARYEFLGLTPVGSDIPELNIRAVAFSKTMGSRELARTLRDFSPHRLIYLPEASLTANSFFRAWRLKRIVPGAPLVLVGLQARRHPPIVRALLRHARPDFLMVSNRGMAAYFEAVKLPARVMPSGVDVEKYAPAAPEQKKRLRQKYGVPEKAFLITHAGHLRASRNLELLEAAGRLPGAYMLMIASSHGVPDQALKARLQAGGVDVRGEYIENMQEIYQMSDAYLFPVADERGAIGMPLSVLEALACDLPVISLPFGDLPKTFPDADAIRFIQGAGELEMVRSALVRDFKPGSARPLALPYAWEKMFDRLWPDILNSAGPQA